MRSTPLGEPGPSGDGAGAPSPRPEGRVSRTLLYLPFLGLFLAILGYSGYWVLARNATVEAVDAWTAREAAAGRRWTCPNRSVGGYPFRIELRCDAPTVTVVEDGRTTAEGRLTGLTALARAYAPRHVIAEAQGPLVLSLAPAADAPPTTLTLAWTRARASAQTSEGGLGAFSISFDGLEASEAGAGRLLLANHLEGHWRPAPARAAENAVDIAASGDGLQAPLLDGVLGAGEPAKIELRVVATQAREALAAGGVAGLERWRTAGGRLEIALARLNRGASSLDATGALSLDAARRPEGRLDLAAVGFENVLRGFGLGGSGGGSGNLLGGLVGGLLGGNGGAAGNAVAGNPVTGNPATGNPAAGNVASGNPAANGAARRPPALRVPLRFEGGRLFLGPLPVARVSALY